MELRFEIPGIDSMLAQIMEFQQDDTPEFWSAPLYRFYPQLDRTHAFSLPESERITYLDQTLRQVYADQLPILESKAALYAAHWENCKSQITAALSDAFAIDCSLLFNDMVCRISLNPIEPRFLRQHAFDIFYRNSERGAIGEAIHEMIHLVWFHVWQQEFGDSWEEYESPSLKWILSEMVVESIMRDERLRSLNPYFSQENGGCVYPYFYTMTIAGSGILDTLADMYRTLPIVAFMRESYAYCLAHEREIRQHIRQAEG